MLKQHYLILPNCSGIYMFCSVALEDTYECAFQANLTGNKNALVSFRLAVELMSGLGDSSCFMK